MDASSRAAGGVSQRLQSVPTPGMASSDPLAMVFFASSRDTAAAAPCQALRRYRHLFT